MNKRNGLLFAVTMGRFPLWQFPKVEIKFFIKCYLQVRTLLLKNKSKLKQANLCVMYYNNIPIFTFSYTYAKESIVFASNLRNGDFDGFRHFKVPWIQKITFLCGWSLYVSLIRIAQKQITTETSNLAFYICVTWDFL